MIRSGISPQPMITIIAGAESSQRLLVALCSCSAATIAVRDTSTVATGGGAAGVAAVSVVISVFQDLHGFGCDPEAHRVAHLQHVLMAAAVLHPDRHVAAGIEVDVEMRVGAEIDDVLDLAGEMAFGARPHQVDALRPDREGHLAADRDLCAELARHLDARGQADLALVADA